MLGVTHAGRFTAFCASSKKIQSTSINMVKLKGSFSGQIQRVQNRQKHVRGKVFAGRQRGSMIGIDIKRRKANSSLGLRRFYDFTTLVTKAHGKVFLQHSISLFSLLLSRILPANHYPTYIYLILGGVLCQHGITKNNDNKKNNNLYGRNRIVFVYIGGGMICGENH